MAKNTWEIFNFDITQAKLVHILKDLGYMVRIKDNMVCGIKWHIFGLTFYGVAAPCLGNKVLYIKFNSAWTLRWVKRKVKNADLRFAQLKASIIKNH